MLENIVIIKDAIQDYYFNFKQMNYSIEEYVTFIKEIGVFNLLGNHLISNLYDYVTGVEVEMYTQGGEYEKYL